MVKLQSLPQFNVVVKTKRNQFKQNNLQLVKVGRGSTSSGRYGVMDQKRNWKYL